jgi:halocyanin-like protein
MSPVTDRRTLVRTLGVLAAGGSLAGCSGDGDGGGGNGGDPVESYLSNTGNFDGIEDLTGQDGVTVRVGTEGNGGYWGFSPAAIRISTGTTVTWEWTGRGSSHNVVAEDGASFQSDYAIEQGHTFEQTFDSPATVTYYCQPHLSYGMKGAIVVEE